MVAIGAFGQLGFDVMLAAAEQDGADALAHLGEVLVVGRATFSVELIEVAVEAEERDFLAGILRGVSTRDADGREGKDRYRNARRLSYSSPSKSGRFARVRARACSFFQAAILAW